ncbi:hypothetical protein [Accumulibacter sp.]|uniref:hypothetical protein n=1 Tax=Accumulibacter sp. TaxID=2053492 RepID=UPI0025FA270B|nr:hypothetical protein [Accumulibacter sp.]MCM8613801.1 hypothetical protein [Accumulibacter sp.]MCM8637467.1 hypothetical protein [Accumulibacter sp.]MCM8638446.1 hypothetical protein [Accumulibacter sp.]
MKKKLVAGCLLALCLLPPAFAASEAGGAKKPKSIPFATTTCGDLLDIFAAADPKLNKDKKMLKGAQDRAFAYVAWTHGYLNGRDGIDARRYPFDEKGVMQLVGVMFNTCKGNDSKLFLDAVKDMR